MQNGNFTRRNFIALAASYGWVAHQPALASAVGGDQLAELGLRLKGVLLTPKTASYEQARRTFSFNPRMDMHPLAIARCSDEGDVLRCLEFATKNRMDLAVRGGGHDVLAASTCNGGLVIDTSAMNQVSRTASGTCVTGAGARAGAINSFLQPMQLAVPLGDTPSVGVAGLTLGGGLGWLLGRYGTACDNLVRARIVLADGRILNVDQHEHQDLFWALRGGGGNFGLVTELEFKTHRVDKVMAGKVVYSGSNLTNFLHWFAEFRDSAPDDLTTELTVLGGDEPIILISVCYSGRSELADQAVAPLLKNFSPLADSLKWLDYAQVTDPDKKSEQF